MKPCHESIAAATRTGMHVKYSNLLRPALLLTLPLLLTACAAGDSQFSADDPAGFWSGLWHGIISVISLVIHIFNDQVLVYETDNTGGWYDFGFLIGVICVWGGGSQIHKKTRAQSEQEKEWDELGDKFEIKFKRELKNWAEDESGETAANDADWDEIGDKIANKLKRKLKQWAEDEAEDGEDWDEIGDKVEKKLKRKIREWADKD